MQTYSRIAPHPRLFTTAQKLAALGTRLAALGSDYVRLPALTGWGYSKDLPRFAGRTFRDRWQELSQNTGQPGETETGKQVDSSAAKQMAPEERQGQASRTRRELVSSFVEELTKVNGNVHHTNPAEITNQVMDFLRSREIDQIHLEPNLLDESVLRKAGLRISHAPDPALPAGVTRAICGLADTGSILIADGEGNPLQASLLPGIHIAVLCVSGLLPSLADALRLPIVSRSRAAVVITGPSRTADIEMSLTIGMHGPAELHVFLVHTIC
jgi:L-lactate utilization protein LutC